jgi:redox-sensitive bicupin YhaK (pirin superfamily)
MSNLETVPEEIICTEGARGAEGAAAGVEFLAPREVPLGGPRAMPVRRTLPQKQRSLIGAWCFLDHYGPDLVPQSGGMRVPRHPHTGLATVSWLFTGKIAHRDSAGYEAIVRPGEVNLMIAGRGISHQEFSTPDTGILHGAQLWYALPEETRNMPPTFEHYAPQAVIGEGSEVRVFLGSLAGSSSPVATYTPPLLGAEAVLRAGAQLELELDASFEHGILVDTGEIFLDGVALAVDHLHYLPLGRSRAVLTAGQSPARILILGGQPLGEQIVMWWNFVGRAHEEVVAYRAAWQAEIGAEPAAPPAGGTYPDGAPYPRFGPYPEGYPAPLPAPALPNAQLKPRG